jgi:tetratricopeptide (TPR) repeat protein
MANTVYLVLMCCFLRTPEGTARNPDYASLLQQARAEYLSGNLARSETLLLAALKALHKDEEELRASTLAELGDLYLGAEKFPKAERAFLDSLDIYRRLSQTNGVVVNLQSLGSIYSLQRRDDDALHALQQALKFSTAKPGSDPAITAQVLNSLGIAHYLRGDAKKAGHFFTDALELVSAAGVKFDTAQLLNNLGVMEQAKGNLKRAEDLLTEALKQIEAESGTTHPNLVFTLSALGGVYTDSGRYADAESQYRRALQILEPFQPELETRYARILNYLSVSYGKAGRKSESDALLAQAAVIARRNLSDHLDMIRIIEMYSATLKSRGKAKEAEELRVEARRARLSSSLVITAHRPFE